MCIEMAAAASVGQHTLDSSVQRDQDAEVSRLRAILNEKFGAARVEDALSRPTWAKGRGI